MMGSLFLIAMGWVIGASALGYAISAIFIGALKLTRNRFLAAYVSLAGVFLYTFFHGK